VDLLEVVDQDHAGKVRIEIDLARSKVQLEDARLVGVELWIRILAGQPQLVGNELVYPVELPGMGTYDRQRDGEIPAEQIGKVLLRRALELAQIGASALLEVRPTTPMDLVGISIVDCGGLAGAIGHLSKPSAHVAAVQGTARLPTS